MAGRDLIMVLLDSADQRSRLQDAERIRQFAGGEPPPPPVRKAARTGKDQRPAKAGAKQQQAKTGNRQPRLAQGNRTRGDVRVPQTFTPKQAAGKKDRDG